MRYRDRRAQGRLDVGTPKRSKYGERKRCVWCNIAVKYHGTGDTRATREHVMPKSYGGGGGPNVTMACFLCNNTRGRQTTWIPWEQVPDWQRRVGTAYAYGSDGIVEEICKLP